MPDGAQTPGPGEGTQRRFLTFRIGGALYAIGAETVSEVIRVPPVARVPLGPKGLLGIANLRGDVLPIASLRGLLGLEAAAPATTWAIVIEGAAPVGLAVDAVETLASVDEADIETRQAELAVEGAERLAGAFRANDHGAVAKILDLKSLLDTAFVPRARVHRVAPLAQSLAGFGESVADDRQKLVTFEIAGQEFALALDVVREIVRAPEQVASLPRGEAVVLGVMTYRDSLLPLLSLRGLLGFQPRDGDGEGERVVVTRVGGVLAGLVADRMRAILPADAARIEPTPPMLAARTGGEARIKAIYRGDDGRLISILDPEQLFREDVMARLGTNETSGPTPEAKDDADGELLQFVVFRLGEDEFGLPIGVVDEVARTPEQITRLPKTPAFLEGVINLRGEVLPIVDQRKRFDMPPLADTGRRRLIVVKTERHKAGLIVDSVSEVLRSHAGAIEPAPDLAGETTRLVHGVINLEQAGRLILLLDPSELLTRAERGLLDAFQGEDAAPA
jgi:purine-binding chemotaxis protein CheW